MGLTVSGSRSNLLKGGTWGSSIGVTKRYTGSSDSSSYRGYKGFIYILFRVVVGESLRQDTLFLDSRPSTASVLGYSLIVQKVGVSRLLPQHFGNPPL